MTTLSPALSLAIELMARKSVTPDDAGCQTIMTERLAAIGFNIETLRFGEVDNFWAVRGTEGPIFAFAGHTDVVPAGDEQHWQYPPYQPAIIDGMLRGRGAADMKGSLAAMVVACEAFVAAHPNHRGRIAFLITSDEEGVATHGTVKVIEHLEARNEKITWCLVGEPSSTAMLGDTVKNGRRGSLGAKLTINGIQGHVAYPHLARNPIHEAMPALAALTAEHWDDGNEYFQATSLQISNINSGTGATNVIPANATVIFNFRFSTQWQPTELQARTEAILDRFNLDYHIDWTLSGMPFLTEVGNLTQATTDAIATVTGTTATLSTGGGTSDGRFIAPTGAQVIELGPVNATIHKVDECVAADDISHLAKIYEHILINLLG